ncbi:Forkhead associated (FHA) domain, binds pSer, pThr, pTyr [Ruminococcus flavefaciens]|uniref:Forkhead associated (FHA) domain, binds pSer, pThr, pTyr n=1 Tax=Ruminococcus flavefaciens TaxID=1265 RepID=A0A1H6J9K9_RUMFL|nr:FHA domain-containing protein [Ruminococcus flavefaciens]SEH57053.1 Forkhead associated (FHA) domain, binds pSer, pThr, pTyr [Ruminococcus flavefaciens]
MAKLKFTEINGEVCIKCRFTGNEMLNEPEYRYFIDNRIKGWLVPFAEGSDRLEFTGAKGIPLINKIRSGIDKKEYFCIIKNLLDIIKVAETCGFNMQNIVLDPDFITVNAEDLDIYLFYLPLWYNESCNDGIVNCLRKISTFAQYKSQSDYSAVDGFMNFVCRESGFTISEAKEYIRREVPSLFPAQTAKPAHTQFSRPHIPEPSQHINNMAQTIINDINKGSQEFKHTAAPEVPEPKIIPSLNSNKKNVLPELVKSEHIRSAPQNYPKLTRRATGITVNIDKPVFRIGKERDKVDLCITENRTVSRVHATIYTRSGSCYIEDNNSTNRTYINGTAVPANMEIKIKNGDVLKLSNEEFDFIDG